MNMLRILILLIAVAFAATANAAQPQTLPKGSLACATEAAFDRQFKYLSQGVQRWVSGCGSTKVDQKVVVVDYNVFEATEVVVVANDTTLFILGRDLKRDEERQQPVEPQRESTPKQVFKYERPSS